MADIDNDNGYSSRKFWLVQEVLVLFAAGYAATIHWEAARPEFGTWGGLVLAALSVYFGVNFAHKKWAPGGQPELTDDVGPTPKAPVEEEPLPKVPVKK